MSAISTELQYLCVGTKWQEHICDIGTCIFNRLCWSNKGCQFIFNGGENHDEWKHPLYPWQWIWPNFTKHHIFNHMYMNITSLEIPSLSTDAAKIYLLPFLYFGCIASLLFSPQYFQSQRRTLYQDWHLVQSTSTDCSLGEPTATYKTNNAK